jgi:DNA polymerase III epsilon subunit-like protein
MTSAPRLTTVTPHLAARRNGAYLIGHNIGVDWRLLHRHCPSIHIAGLIDTYRLARTIPTTGSRGLTALLDAHHLTDQVNAAAPASAPHRALWDTIGAALLLDALIRRRWTHDPALGDLLDVAARTPSADQRDLTEPMSQLNLLDPGTHDGGRS